MARVAEVEGLSDGTSIIVYCLFELSQVDAHFSIFEEADSFVNALV